ncbi:WD repeat-containing protein 75 [Mactra antiquata]
MAASMEHMDSEREQVHFPLRSGASIVKVRPIFSHDSKLLFVCSGSVIKVFSVQSRECIHELRGHQGDITGLAIHPKNKLQLLSCSLDQTIIIWDYTDGVFIRDIHQSAPLHGMYTVEGKKDIFVLIQNQKNHKNKSCTLCTVSLSKSSTSNSETVLNHCMLDTKKTTIGPKGAYVASVHGKKLVWNFYEGEYYEHKSYDDTEFTCVVSHPVENCITTGCSDGKIYTWYIQDDRLISKVDHWHAMAVKDLCITTEGSHLLSGGYECTLVKWHPYSGEKDFLPRLGAPINYISCSQDNLYYALCLDDNVIQLVTCTFAIQNVYQGLTRVIQRDTSTGSFPAGMTCDPRSKALVLNGKPGHIQFYSVHEDKQLYNLDIVSQNIVSSHNVDNPLTLTDVVQMAFNSNGNWLATLEYWNDGVMSPEMRLKFWSFSYKEQCFILNTIVEEPHNDTVNTLKFRPLHSQSSAGMENMAVTSGNDGKFKIWNLVDDSDIYRSNEKWACESVGFYRNLPAGQTDFSEDGSLLAVTFDSTITLWNPETNLLQQTLFNALNLDPVRFIQFGLKDCCHYLVSTTDNVLTVWNLISCCIQWSADVNIVCITKDPCTDIMAAFTQSKELIVFKPSSPTPVFSATVFSANSVKTTQVLSATFVPHHKKSLYEKTTLSWQSKSELYFINKDQELLSVALMKDSKSVRTKEDVAHLERNLPQSALSLLISSKLKSTQKNKENVTLQPTGKFTRELLSSAAHVQPSVISLCKPFIQSLMIPVNGRSGDKTDDDDSDEEDESVGTLTQTVSQDSGLDSDMETDEIVSQSIVSINRHSQIASDSEDAVRSKPNVRKTVESKSDKEMKKVCEKFEGIQVKAVKDTVSEQMLGNIFASDLSWFKS